MAIVFPSSLPGTRPVRCCEATRQFAADSLAGIYGRQLDEFAPIEMADIPGYGEMTRRQQMDLALARIAQEAPIRHCPGELIVGSASLKDAVRHVTPIRYNGENILTSISHLTLGFDKLLREGWDSYTARVKARLEEEQDEEKRQCLNSMRLACEAFYTWHGRYLAFLAEKRDAAEDEAQRAYYDALYQNLEHVPAQPPRHFREGVQALWFAFAFVRLCGNWPGIGRIDVMLGDLLENDLRDGVITIEEAREVMAHFFIKGCEWVSLRNVGSGDGQHYQNLVLAGVDAEGRPLCNAVTRLVLEVVEELPIGDYPIAVRLRKDHPEWLKQKVAEVMRHGSGVVAVYNDELVMNSMIDFGYTAEQASRFANDGCWEVQVPGESWFLYQPMDAYGPFEQDVLGLGNEQAKTYDSYEALEQAYIDRMRDMILVWQNAVNNKPFDPNPTPVISLFVEDCIGRGRDYGNGGPRFEVFSPHLGGLPDVANSLYAIKKLVFDEKKLDFAAFMKILQNDWADAEPLRQYVSNRYLYYGNDNDEVDGILSRIVNAFMDVVLDKQHITGRTDILRPPGISTFGREVDWHPGRYATAYGKKAGSILAGHLNPSPGTNISGATAIIRSHCKMGLHRLTCGTALDIKLDPSAVKGEDGVQAVVSLLEGFLALGGFFMQVDVLDNAVLLEAQQHPEEYKGLTVRVAGWSARFITLNKEWQQMIIERTAQTR